MPLPYFTLSQGLPDSQDIPDARNVKRSGAESMPCCLVRHWCFKAKWRTQVDAFWDAGIAAGGSDEGPPGLRNYHASYYAAFLRDPDGNRIEAVCHHAVK